LQSNEGFPDRISQYHSSADPERDSAVRLAKALEPWRYSVPPGPILEIGSGTGLFSEKLISMFPKRDITLSDSSDMMLGYLQDKDLADPEINLRLLDAETDHIEELSYSMISGNHVAHQFQNPQATLEKLASCLKVDGIMLMAFPGEDSFGEWRSACLDLGIPYTGRSMPATEPLVIHLSMGPVQVDFYEDQSICYFNGFSDFLAHCKRGGAGIEREENQLSDRDLKLLEQNWKNNKDNQIALTYHNVFLAVKRVAE